LDRLFIADHVAALASGSESWVDANADQIPGVQRVRASNKNFHKPDDLIFANRSGKALDRHHLLHRHVKPVAEKPGIEKTVDFRSFRTIHASFMRRFGARLEVARDNMGHAGSLGSITLDVYSKTWWNERVDAVSRVVEPVFAEPIAKEGEKQRSAISLRALPDSENGNLWEPSWEPQAV